VPEETPVRTLRMRELQGRSRTGANEGSEGSRSPNSPPKRARTFVGEQEGARCRRPAKLDVLPVIPVRRARCLDTQANRCTKLVNLSTFNSVIFYRLYWARVLLAQNKALVRYVAFLKLFFACLEYHFYPVL
jgi:hypothetical protein